MASPEEAEEIVRRLTRKYGFLNEQMMDDIEQFNAQYRREIDENWLAMESAVSHSVKILAKQIYGSGARFVFELLQNAEDNVFKKARGKDEAPFILFRKYPNRIVVDCNEDGFTEKDLQAICAVGQSAKSASHGYIGAKGIGFKSVFMVASRVHIQSGNFSFEFRHNKTDPGIGMVRPIWVNPTETIPSPLTRITLYIHDQGDPADIQHLKRVISMQFDELQETCLLFLRKLKKISLEFYGENGELEGSKQFRKEKIDDHRWSLETTSVDRGEETTRSQIFHITRQTATGLTRSDDRELPDSEKARGILSRAEVVLAFPITNDHEPLITRKNQDLFAFLPLGTSKYKFLIHSDFDTNVNRQAIVTTSRRNLELRGWIATTFFKAILQFCEDSALCYNWPLFLPPPNNSSDAFWSGLDGEIRDLMRQKPVLKSRNREHLRLISDVLILTSVAKDTKGHPIFDDVAKDLYLSPNYPQKVVDILKDYGLKPLSDPVIVSLLETDLDSPNSKMHGKDATDEWHEAVARMLSGIFHRSVLQQWRLGPLPLLPLRSGEWTSKVHGAVYFPKAGDIDIPDSLSLRVISPSASKNLERNALFKLLGVRYATIDQVRASIFSAFDGGPLFLSDIDAFLNFLYLTHQDGKHTLQEYATVTFVCRSSSTIRRSPLRTDLYLPGTDHAYSPEGLLAAEGAAPGLSAEFLLPRYLENVPNRRSSSHPTWKRWLCDCIGVRERLRLVSRDGATLSDTFLYVHKYRPDKFLGLFEHLWLHEKSSLLRDRTLRTKVEELSAEDLCGVSFSLSLKRTWLPLQVLRELVERYMEYPEQFPFLRLEESETIQEIGSKWNFLCDYFSVRKDDTVDFLLEILECIQRSCLEPSLDCQSQKVFDLYVAIYAKLAVTNDGSEARRKTREFFYKGGVLSLDEEGPSWTSSFTCFWVAPPDMMTASSLKIHYARKLDEDRFGNVENLFRRILGIGNASLDDLVYELNELRDVDCSDRYRMRAIYEYLDESNTPISDLRAAFEGSPLIYCETQRGKSGWYKTSDCLWSSETIIRGKAILDECWEAHEAFFVEKLGVKLLTLQMVYDELRQSPRTTTEDIKVAILSLNGLLQTESMPLDPGPIRKAKIFPVRYPNGTVVLSSVDVDFAIGDRDSLKTMFRDKTSLLDFELDDVRCLKPLIEWLRLQDRYLSKCVEESTSISSDSGCPISSPNRDLKRKAYYIARVAATFKSPRFQDDPVHLYEQLRTMEVIEADGISSVLKIFQNKQPFEVPLATANEHIDDTTGNLIIYVPKDRRAQELCFGSVLPRKLAAWLMQPSNSLIDGPVEVEAVNALTSIFASERSVLDDILDDQGILSLSFGNEDESSNEEDEDEEEIMQEDRGQQVNQEGEGQEHNHFGADDTSSEQQTTPTHSSINGTASPHAGESEIGPEESDIETLVETISRRSHMSNQPPPAVAHHSSQLTTFTSPSQSFHHAVQAPSNLSSALAVQFEGRSSEDAGYRAILDRVVEKARRATFPSRGSFDMSDMRNALPVADAGLYESFDGLTVVTRFRSANQFERDKKIGAAGELYVYELLKQLGLRGFARTNWQSTIRSYVTVHPDYTDLGAWGGSETADLVYSDTEGNFTDALIGSGYLNHDEWHGARPKFYIEVKTTTGPCGTPFYMSAKQYRLMGRIHHSEDRSEIYMVFRVFWLNSDRIGMCVYLDPEQLRQDGRLLFKGQTWAVTPGPSSE